MNHPIIRLQVAGRLARLLLGLALIPGFVGLAPTTTYAASFTVTTLSDGGEGSLRAAIDAANNQAGSDTITFDVTGTIVLGSTLPTISDQLSIAGPGSSSLTISGNNMVSVFRVESSALNLSGVTVANGSGDDFSVGGGITSRRATLTISDSAFSANRTSDSGGAIISNLGSTLTIANSDFSGNSASTGGVIYSNIGSVVHISGSTFSGNSAGTGGVIFSVGEVTISDSTFSANNAQFNAGGVVFLAGDDSTLAIANSTFAGNSASSGGVLYMNGTLTVASSTFSDNSASGSAGAIFNNGTLTVAFSTFSGNSAGSGGAAILNNGTTNISASTFSANRAQFYGGAISNNSMLTVTNSTFAGNTTTYFGGGISNGGFGTAIVASSTFVGNSASDGGAIHNISTATAHNTIIANSPTGGNCAGTLSDLGGNLSSDATCGYTAASSRNDTDPRLGELQDNGGPTLTVALQADSPAIDSAVDCTPPAADQRGIVRPQGAACDSGAFEFRNQSPTAISLTPASVAENQPAGATVGTFAAADPDAGDTFAYALVAGDGDADNGSFTLDGATLKTAAPLDYETKHSYTIRVQATDRAGSTLARSFTITVTNANDSPTVTVVAGGTCISDTSGRITLSVSDVDSSNLSLSASSSNPALVPVKNVVFGAGTGPSRTATITAMSGRTGTAGVTLTVSDGQMSSSVTVTVQAGGNGNDALAGTDATDMLFGQNGDDTLVGQGGIDLLCGGSGNDVLAGGVDADSFDGGKGVDRVTDRAPGEPAVAVELFGL